MNKNLFLTAAFILSSLVSTNAQHILRSDVLYNNEIHQQQYLFVRADAKTVEKDWKTYLSKFGKVSESKGEITVEKIKAGGLGSFVDHAVSFVRDEKDFAVVSLLFFDDNDRSLDEQQIKKEGLEKLFYDFYDMAYFNEEIRMAEEDLAYANDLLQQAEKDKGKAERNLEANLRSQEKLGKKLDQTPEELSKVIQEKDAVYQELLKASEEEAEKKEDLKEEMSEKDKQIVKLKDKKERDSDKLEKREEEFPTLTQELFAARKYLEKAQQVVESKKLVLQELKAKR